MAKSNLQYVSKSKTINVHILLHYSFDDFLPLFTRTFTFNPVNS